MNSVYKQLYDHPWEVSVDYVFTQMEHSTKSILEDQILHLVWGYVEEQIKDPIRHMVYEELYYETH